MRSRELVYETAARADLDELYDYIADRDGERIARTYLQRVEAAFRRLAASPIQGRQADEIEPGLRITGFERRASICFKVTGDEVRIVRFLYGGRDLAKAFRKR